MKMEKYSSFILERKLPTIGAPLESSLALPTLSYKALAMSIVINQKIAVEQCLAFG